MKKIIKSICFSLLAFMFAIGSIFLPIGSKNTNHYASADVTTASDIVFNSSDLLFNLTPYVSSISFDPSLYAGLVDTYNNISIKESLLKYSFSVKYRNTGFGNFFNMYLNAFFDDSYYLGSCSLPDGTGSQIINTSQFSDDYGNDYYGINFNDRFLNSSINTIFIPVLYDYHLLSETYHTVITFGIDRSNVTSSVPSLVMKYVEIGSYADALANNFAPTSYSLSYDDGSTFINNQSFKDHNIIKYVDSTGYIFYFYIPVYAKESTSPQYFYEYRRYILNLDELTDNDYYEQGLNTGLSTGYDSGYSTGYTAGQNSGYSNGYEDGKIDGALESENFTFVGLFSAILDTPVKILTNLFNFDFLGINLWAFFTSILTIGLIVFVVKIFLRR